MVHADGIQLYRRTKIEMAVKPAKNLCDQLYNDHSKRVIGFHGYYQMHREDDNPEASAAGSNAKDELISVGLNSLWGMIYMIMEKLGMSWYEIMWKRSWINIEMMLADAPRMERAQPEKKDVPTLTGKEVAARLKSRKRK